MKIIYTPRLPEGAKARIVERFPEAEFLALSANAPELRAELETADVIAGWVPVEALAACKQLRWLQLGSAGAEAVLGKLPETVLLTNASGVFDLVMAEHAMALILALARGVDRMVQAKAQTIWNSESVRGELFGKTLTVVGFGNIGRTVAERAKCFGMRVIGVKRRAAEKPACADEVIGIAELDAVLPRTDHLLFVLPGGPHTRHVLDARRLKLLPPHSMVYNIGRGNAIDEAALAESILGARLGGAGLDVFESEPLPETSPLWGLPNVIISPHLAGRTSNYPARFFEIFFDNLKRFQAGEPLRNEVDRYWGY